MDTPVEWRDLQITDGPRFRALEEFRDAARQALSAPLSATETALGWTAARRKEARSYVEEVQGHLDRGRLFAQTNIWGREGRFMGWGFPVSSESELKECILDVELALASMNDAHELLAVLDERELSAALTDLGRANGWTTARVSAPR